MGKRIAVIGGDMRQVSVAECFLSDGYDVSVYGFDKKVLPHQIPSSESLTNALDGCKTVVLGITPCDEKMKISTPFFKEALSADCLAAHLSPECTIIGGKLSSGFIELCKKQGISCIDYACREDFAVLNAVPSAEGAIAIAMQELPVTLHETKCLVTGFGRIGKILARILYSLGADVTCTARKSHDLAWINALGYKAVHTDNLISCVHNVPVIFNTVPNHIFSRDILRNITPGTLIIDLASKPGGVDMESATALGIKVIWALSLPGKTSPVTAGKIIKDTIVNILNEI